MATLRGKDGFDSYYNDLFGSRWESIKSSFSNDPKYIEWNPYNKEPYFLDSASVLAAYSLPLDDANTILDMCAAPGGKSLVLSHRMKKDSLLLCNERSASRRNRLVHVLDDSLESSIRSRVKIAANDGALMCKREGESFDAILLDAPCSSERHVLQDEKYLEQWSSARIKNLAVTQWSLLSSAFRMLKESGYIVYSTCALSPVENDNVVKKLLKKFDSATVKHVDFSTLREQCIHDLPQFEKTEYGYHVLPDVHENAGPLYFSLVQKNYIEK